VKPSGMPIRAILTPITIPKRSCCAFTGSADPALRTAPPRPAVFSTRRAAAGALPPSSTT
jgi:hypothetical protein